MQSSGPQLAAPTNEFYERVNKVLAPLKPFGGQKIFRLLRKRKWRERQKQIVQKIPLTQVVSKTTLAVGNICDIYNALLCLRIT